MDTIDFSDLGPTDDANPLAAAARYGQRTGTCSCCGRLLTNHTSIGPVCRSKWGL